jgi:transglutaminase-like putative cysteine protease
MKSSTRRATIATHPGVPLPRPARSPIAVTVALWGILALLQVSPLAVLRYVPWAAHLAWWALPAAVGTGVVLGALLVLVTPSGRWWTVLPFILVLAVAAGAGGLEIVRATYGPRLALGTLLLGAYATMGSALLPWLVVRARQDWLAATIILLTDIGASALLPAGPARPLFLPYWLAGIFACALVLLALSALREEMLLWRALRLQRVGAVVWSAMGLLLALSSGVAALGLLPEEALRWQPLSALYQRSPLARHGPLTETSPQGAPLTVPGEALNLASPGVQGNAVLYTYDVLGGTPGETPLLATTFDQFDGATWTQSAAASIVPVRDRLALPPGAVLLKGRVTVAAALPADATPLLVGFSQPIGFSLQAQARLLTADAPTPLTVAEWQALGPLRSGTTYVCASAVLPADVQPSGSLPPDLRAQLTAVPPALQPSLVALARQWLGAATRAPAAEAQALLEAMQRHLQFDAETSAPVGVDGTQWFLAHGRGNGLLWASTYALLGRALGLPLRLAEGYLPGTYDLSIHHLVVRQSDAAVWVQLAIPEVGWTDVFPAATLRVVKKLPTVTGVSIPPASPPRGNTPSVRLPGWPTVRAPSTSVLLGAGAIVVLLTLLALALAMGRWARLGRGRTPIGAAFARMAVLARLAGIELQPSDTARAGARKVAHELPDTQARALGRLTTVYERVSYGPRVRRVASPREVAPWRAIRNALLRRVLLRRGRRRSRRPPEMDRHPIPATRGEQGDHHESES